MSYLLGGLIGSAGGALLGNALSSLSSYNSSTSKYPGSTSSPWLPGSNAVNTPTSSISTTTPKTTSTTTTTPTATGGTTAKNPYGNQDQYDSYLQGLDYGLPDVEQISWSDALARAESMYKPQYEQSVLARNKMASDQRERLAQLMAARGYSNPRGGKMQAGEGEITQEQAMALENIRNDYESNKNQMASNIYEGESQRNLALLNSLINQQNQKNMMTWNTWNAKQSAAMQKEESELTRESNWLDRILRMYFPDFD